MNSQLYCYGSRYLSQRNLGKLIGTTFCLAGVISLITNPMKEFSLINGYGPMCAIALALSVFVAVLLGILQCMDSKYNLQHNAENNEILSKKEVQVNEEMSAKHRTSEAGVFA